jgi:hypothetical protein
MPTGEPTTFHQIAIDTVDDLARGRFAKQSPSVVIGSAGPPQYPPAAVTFDDNPEPPFPVDINYVEPVGSLAEQGRAAQILAEAGKGCSVLPEPVASPTVRRRF